MQIGLKLRVFQYVLVLPINELPYLIRTVEFCISSDFDEHYVKTHCFLSNVCFYYNLLIVVYFIYLCNIYTHGGSIFVIDMAVRCDFSMFQCVYPWSDVSVKFPDNPSSVFSLHTKPM